MSEQSSVVCLVNDHTSVRERASEGVTVLACCCAYSDVPYRWIQLCRLHAAEDLAIHEQARRDHDHADAIKELTS
jgi:hypothetical protein